VVQLQAEPPFAELPAAKLLVEERPAVERQLAAEQHVAERQLAAERRVEERPAAEQHVAERQLAAELRVAEPLSAEAPRRPQPTTQSQGQRRQSRI
jgi:hypothetical protein